MKLRLNRVGTMHIGNTVDVTDPCYTPGSVVVKTVRDMIPGEYNCYVHVNRASKWGPYVQALWIVHGEHSVPFTLPPEGNWDRLGWICVDSGLAGFFDRKPDLNPEWGELIEWMCDEDRRLGDRLHAYQRQLDGRDAFWSPAGAGDGDYRYYGWRTDAGICALCLWFDDEE